MLLLTVLFSYLLASCQEENTCKYEHPEWLYGRWKVFHINMGGEQIGGPGFRGTEYTFQENGIVRTESAQGDTASVRFEYNCDTITYLHEGGNETYTVDTLTKEKLRLGYITDGIPSTVDFLRMQ